MSSVSYVGPVKVVAPLSGDSPLATLEAADEEGVEGLIWP
jgi:hypothetical protein